MQALKIPFHRADIGDDEINEVVDTLRSGWLTTGPKTKRFEKAFSEFCGAKHVVAVNSATAALHLALDAVQLKRGDGVLVPTMTFAATAEVVRYFDAEPLLFDCRESDLNGDYNDAKAVLRRAIARGIKVRALVAVHYGGLMGDMAAAVKLAKEFNLALIEDAAHCCQSYYRDGDGEAWKAPGSEGAIACYSFYANKCITTGEGGMAATNDDNLADRMRIMSLHGISKDAWKRFTSEGSWYYEILSPGFKYNLTDIASAVGIHQLAKAEKLRRERERVALQYNAELRDCEGLGLPDCPPNRIHSWHLYPIRIDARRCGVERASVIDALRSSGIGTSVHWMPLHMHPYYRDRYGYKPDDLPVARREYEKLVSLPIFPGMSEGDVTYVSQELKRIVKSG